MKLTANQIAAYVGAGIAILIAALDTWLFNHAFGVNVDLILLGVGIGILTGQTVPLVGGVVAAARTNRTTP